MVDLTIRPTRLESICRHVVDAAVHGALREFRDTLGEKERLVYEIATAAATSAVEQFSTICNAELRLIQIREDQTFRELMLKTPSVFFENARNDRPEITPEFLP